MEQENFKISSSQELKEEEIKTADYVKSMLNHLFGLKGKMMEINEKIADITEELEKKYPDLRETYLFHAMIFSTTDRGQCSRFDLPGEDSIVKRLEDLVKEYEAQ